jgi:hypothetical protein
MTPVRPLCSRRSLASGFGCRYSAEYTFAVAVSQNIRASSTTTVNRPLPSGSFTYSKSLSPHLFFTLRSDCDYHLPPWPTQPDNPLRLTQNPPLIAQSDSHLRLNHNPSTRRRKPQHNNSTLPPRYRILHLTHQYRLHLTRPWRAYRTSTEPQTFPSTHPLMA